MLHSSHKPYSPSDFISATDVGQLSRELRNLLRTEKNRTGLTLREVFANVRERLAEAIPIPLQQIDVRLDFFEVLFKDSLSNGTIVPNLLRHLSPEDISALNKGQIQGFLAALLDEVEAADVEGIPLPRLRLLFRLAREGKIESKDDLKLFFARLKKDEKLTHDELVLMIRHDASYIAEAPLKNMREEDLRDAFRLIRANRISTVTDFMRFRKDRRTLAATDVEQKAPSSSPIVSHLADSYIPHYFVSASGEVLADDSGAFSVAQEPSLSQEVKDTDNSQPELAAEPPHVLTDEPEEPNDIPVGIPHLERVGLRHGARYGTAFVQLREESTAVVDDAQKTYIEAIAIDLRNLIVGLSSSAIAKINTADAPADSLQTASKDSIALNSASSPVLQNNETVLAAKPDDRCTEEISASSLSELGDVECFIDQALERFSTHPVQWIQLSHDALMRMYVDETENWKETVVKENPTVFANADVVDYVLSEPKGTPADMDSARSAFYAFMVQAKHIGDTKVEVELTYIRSPESLEREMNFLLHLVGGLCYNLPDDAKANEIVRRCETFIELAGMMEDLLEKSIDLVRGEGRSVKKVLPFYTSLLRKLKTGNFFGCLFAPPGQEEKYGTGQAYRIPIDSIPDAPSAIFHIRRTVGLIPQLLLIKDLISKHGELEIVKKLSDEVDLLSGNINPRMTAYLTASRNSMLFQHQTALKVTGSRFLKDHIQGVLYYPDAIDFFTAAMRQKTFQVLWLNNCPPSGEVENVGFYMVDMAISSINPFGNGDEPAEILNNRTLLALSLLGEGKVFRTHDEYLEAFPLLGAREVKGPDKNLRYIQWSPSEDSFRPLLDDDDVLSSIQPPRKQSVKNTAAKAREERMKAAANCQKYEVVPGFRKPSTKKKKAKKRKRKKRH